MPAASRVEVQWFRGATKIKGATTVEDEVSRADLGTRLRAEVRVIGSGVPTTTCTVRTKKVAP